MEPWHRAKAAREIGFIGGLLGLGFIAGGTIAVYAYRRRVTGSVLRAVTRTGRV